MYKLFNLTISSNEIQGNGNIEIKMKYSKTCLKQTPFELKNLFSLDRCLVYTGSYYTDI